jgi:signal transduction histidine kinase/ActR/RegA family two-component response regulator
VKRFFWYSVQGKIITILILFMTLALVAAWFTINYVSETIISGEKEQKLLSFAKLLDTSLGERDYDDILAENGASDASREEKIEILNRELGPLTDDIAATAPGMGVGYYSLELEAILTYGPSEEYADKVGESIAEDHPGRTVMATGEPAVKNGTMVRGNIMNAMYPIARNGEVIGYAWANELSTDIEEQFNDITRSILLAMCVFYVLSIAIAIVLSRRTMRDINNIVKGVRELRFDLTNPLPETDGELGEVVDSINAMAADVAKANEEHEALLMAEAANLAQRDFLARMSHEIRTPMNGVLGMTMLAKNAKTEEQRLEYLEKIHTSASLLLGIINDILDFSKIEAGKMEVENRSFHLRNTIENVRDLISPRIEEKGLELIVSVDESVPERAVGDGLRLSQVLLNLLGNSVKFTSEGSITLRVSTQSLPSGSVRLDCSVQDTGIGMSTQRQEDIFKPFAQADSSTARRFGGTGLGLSISKALVELMGGEITLTSIESKGSSFSFSIELSPSTDVDEDRVEEAIHNHSYEGYSVLVVEDNEVNQEIADAVLTDMGLKLAFAGNGVEGVAAFLEKDYDLIFMDIRMPIMDGLEATRRIRELEKERSLLASGSEHPLHVPIIAMTANAMLEDREASREAGMDGHVSKPIDIAEIQAVLYDTLLR